MSDKFYGTGVALVTPFHEDGGLDETGLANLVNHVIDGGVEYLVVLGTTGESATQTKEEKKRVLEVVKTINDGRRPIVLGVGGNNTQQVIEDIASADLRGVDAILSVSPYYNKPTQEGIYQHYKAIALKCPLPIILYNVPGRTSSNISATTTLRLAEDFENIIAVKEASGNMEQIMEIIQNKPDDFLVISGDDNLTFPMIAMGGAGVISVSGQGFPSIFSQMVRDGLAGKMVEAREAHYRLFEITRMLFSEGNPGGIKAVLHHIGICKEHMRLPLWPISDGLRNSIVEETRRILQ
ncbi:MAG: 4-hydroxy-tetrahydrodipicolinate synthase [Bacteroidota bacterium]|nr:4-hydroxy-tetrahydrodipicolinate synthase [Bacteroidota bacterium]MDX5426629.1 4-hydroxy-tetrahydrodipicolinate synthase [Bacteroidota bacterium]MDX5448562.1 4-hydroxy-tetrahydrodipicolinate synthase [Bacteroidota bacterium]MDX5504638.1 4-hydroxy-tetrahydrodipicolinate synthase [Bacteroidota bacterium]